MTNIGLIPPLIRELVSQIGDDAPPAFRWLRYTIEDTLSSPKWRRFERDQLICELATHYSSISELADAMRCYARVWRRDTKPPEEERKRLLWQIYNSQVDVPVSEKQLKRLVSNQD